MPKRKWGVVGRPSTLVLSCRMAQDQQCREAVRLALAANWDRSHRIVQDMDGEVAAWIHAVLHKIEGDIENSQYWYRRAGRPYTALDPRTELLQIQVSLGAD